MVHFLIAFSLQNCQLKVTEWKIKKKKMNWIKGHFSHYLIIFSNGSLYFLIYTEPFDECNSMQCNAMQQFHVWSIPLCLFFAPFKSLCRILGVNLQSARALLLKKTNCIQGIALWISYFVRWKSSLLLLWFSLTPHLFVLVECTLFIRSQGEIRFR